MFPTRHYITYSYLCALASLTFCIISALIQPVASHLMADSSLLHDAADQGSGKNSSWNTTYTDLLKRDLLVHYDKFARPAQHTNVTTVEMDLIFKHIELDDTKSLMTVNAWVRMIWDDEKLKWNKSDYGGLNKLHVADHEVWEPDIHLFNSATGNNIDHYGNTHLVVYPEGRVLWVPPSQFVVFCEMDLTKWPFDRHTCDLILASWTYGGDMVDLTTNTSSPVEIEQGSYNWKVISIKKERNVRYYKCCDEPYIDIYYYITVQRVSSSYHLIVFAPAAGVMMLCLSIFWIPANSGNKFLVASMTALIQVIFLVYLLQRFSSLGSNTPLIVSYYAYGMVLVGLSMMVSLISYKMATRHNSRPVPWALANLINSKMMAFLMLPKYQGWSLSQRGGEELTERSTLDEDREDLTSIGNHCKRPATAEWFVVATALDRLFFYLYLVFFFGFAVRCLV